jgi:hypothetical protein
MTRKLVVVTGFCLQTLGCNGAPDAGDSPAPPSAPGAASIALRLVASGLSEPVDIQSTAGDSRLFIVEQPGRIRILRAGALRTEPFLDLTDRVGAGGERGLLGLAFHPAYATSGLFYVNYTDTTGTTRISEFRVSVDPDRAGPETERLLLSVAQPFANHNGGALAFGPDEFLYIALGDGGSAGDPLDAAQDLSRPLGKILRIDVDSGAPFAVPSDNPFLASPGAFPPVWAYGLRNPWRFSFDAATGHLYIGDVGQGRVEEINVGLAGQGAENYGWNTTEGSLCFEPPADCSRAGITLPVLEYDHGMGCSVTGGAVYRGAAIPELYGAYVYGDFCTAFIRSFRLEAGAPTDVRDWTPALNSSGQLSSISAFGTDALGELYVADHSAGSVFAIVPAP